MSQSLQARVRYLERLRAPRPELRSFTQAPGETLEHLNARLREWQAKNPGGKTPRIVEVAE